MPHTWARCVRWGIFTQLQLDVRPVWRKGLSPSPWQWPKAVPLSLPLDAQGSWSWEGYGSPSSGHGHGPRRASRAGDFSDSLEGVLGCKKWGAGALGLSQAWLAPGSTAPLRIALVPGSQRGPALLPSHPGPANSHTSVYPWSGAPGLGAGCLQPLPGRASHTTQ